MDEKLISVVIPVQNCQKYIAEALESVVSQDYQPMEVLVIDDGSTDGTAEIVHGFQGQCSYVSYYYQPPSGISRARNRGIDLSQGDFIAFLDADDRWTPGKLSKQMSHFQSGTADMIFGNVIHFLSPEVEKSELSHLVYPIQVMPGYHAGTLLVRKLAFLKVGYFDPKYHLGEFVDWYLRAVDLGLVSLCLDDIFLERRVHQNNVTKKLVNFQQDYVRIIKASLERRRKNNFF